MLIFPKIVTYYKKIYCLCAPDEKITAKAIHTLDGVNFYPIKNIETIGQTPKEFIDRQFYNPKEYK